MQNYIQEPVFVNEKSLTLALITNLDYIKIMKASTGAFFTVVAILIFVIVLATAVRTILLDFNVEDPSAESALETQEEIRKQLQKEKSDQERLMRDIKNQQRSAESRNRSN